MIVAAVPVYVALAASVLLQIKQPVKMRVATLSLTKRVATILIAEMALVVGRLGPALMCRIFFAFRQIFSTDTEPNARLRAVKAHVFLVRFAQWIAFASAESHTRNAKTLTMMDAAISRGS